MSAAVHTRHPFNDACEERGGGGGRGIRSDWGWGAIQTQHHATPGDGLVCEGEEGEEGPG